MYAVRITQDVFRLDGKKSASFGTLGLIDDTAWHAGTLDLPVLCEGKKNRTTIPRGALALLSFGLWDAAEHKYATEAGARLEFNDPHVAHELAAGTSFVVAPLFAEDVPWAPPAPLEGTPVTVETLLALVRR